MIKTTSILTEELKSYSNIPAKIKRMCDSGELYPLSRGAGIYETDSSVPGYCLSGIICGPSYLSFSFALAYHGLIPETVFSFTSATTGKKKARTTVNHFGTFTYRDVPVYVFPAGVLVKYEGIYSYKIASAEKALCDTLYTISPLSNRNELSTVLFDDLRIDPDTFFSLDFNELDSIASLYKTKNHRLLRSFIRKELTK